MTRWIWNGRMERLARDAGDVPSHAGLVALRAAAPTCRVIGVLGLVLSFALPAAAQSETAFSPEATSPAPTPREVAAAAEPTAARPAERAHAERLKLAIQSTAEGDARTRILGGVTGTVIGGLAGAVGVLVAVQHSSTWGQSTGRAALSGTLLTVGISAIAVSVYHWIVVSPAEQRLERWNDLERRDALGPLEMARFEGELQSEAEQSGSMRQSGVVTSLAAFAGSGLLIALSASGAMQGSRARSAGYTIGGIGAALGAAQAAAALFLGSPAERAWRDYTQTFSGDAAALHFERPLRSSRNLEVRLAL